MLRSITKRTLPRPLPRSLPRSASLGMMRMATINAAEILGWLTQLGTLEVGKRNVVFMHVTLVPYIKAADASKPESTAMA